MPGLNGTALTRGQVHAVAEVVRAVVERDEKALGVFPGDDADAFYAWTRDYGTYGEVHLTLPPGEPDSWALDVTHVRGSDPAQLFVVVEMWTTEEGRSDLSLEVRLIAVGDDTWQPTAEALHVL
jgi:hypothetical protein